MNLWQGWEEMPPRDKARTSDPATGVAGTDWLSSVSELQPAGVGDGDSASVCGAALSSRPGRFT